MLSSRSNERSSPAVQLRVAVAVRCTNVCALHAVIHTRTVCWSRVPPLRKSDRYILCIYTDVKCRTEHSVGWRLRFVIIGQMVSALKFQMCAYRKHRCRSRTIRCNIALRGLVSLATSVNLFGNAVNSALPGAPAPRMQGAARFNRLLAGAACYYIAGADDGDG